MTQERKKKRRSEMSPTSVPRAHALSPDLVKLYLRKMLPRTLFLCLFEGMEDVGEGDSLLLLLCPPLSGLWRGGRARLMLGLLGIDGG